MDYYYTYGILNVVTKRIYIGYRHCKIHPKYDIGKYYFSSSSDSDFINEQKVFPDNFRYRVLRIFSNKEDALKHEIYLHNKFDVGTNPKFYNKVKQTNIGFDATNPSRDVREKLSESHIGKRNSQYNTKWMYNVVTLENKKFPKTTEETFEWKNGRKNIFTDATLKRLSELSSSRRHTDESKKKMSEAHKGVHVSEETKEKIRNSLVGRRLSEETKEKIRNSKLGKKRPKWVVEKIRNSRWKEKTNI